MTTMNDLNDHDHEESYEDSCSDVEGGSSSDAMANNKRHSHQQAVQEKLSSTTTASPKYIIYAVILVSAVVFAVATYWFTRTAENTQFVSDFESYAREMAEIAEAKANSFFGQMDSLAIAIAAAMRENYGNNDDFPNVTIPHFDLRTQRITELTGADMILFVPLVPRYNRAGFEHYAVEHQAWIGQDYEYRGWNTSEIQPISPYIYPYPVPDNLNETRRGFVDETGFMDELLLEKGGYDPQNFSAPVAQFGPRPRNSSLALVDLWTHPIFKKEMVASIEYNVPVISEIINLDFLLQHMEPPTPNNTILTPMTTTTMKGFETGQERLRSFTLDPIKKDFFDDSATIGFMVGIVQWETFFANVLPPNIRGIVATVTSDCGSTFTYVINGDGSGNGSSSSTEDWTALGDHHDTAYDDLAQRFKFFWKEHPKGTSRHCHFDLVIYPSDELVDVYMTNKPFVYTAFVLLAFLVTAVAFFMYNQFIQRDKQEVLDQFVRAETIVKSLFPKHVGDQLMQEADKPEQKPVAAVADKGFHATAAAQEQLSGFFDAEPNSAAINSNISSSKPIADLYEDATVFFADIVGFTAWSSTRQPSEVFTLLETLYGKFDKSAKNYHVFKVETIGDCYVAVTGLPERRKDHHICMARFAQSCVSRMATVCQDLVPQLGPETADLGLRVGLHSGPVTAGVLRGERARFQLFGDTVNTAARMESSSKKNCIQVSKETAELLMASNKGHWVTPREDIVNAKGKGELQTYWLNSKSLSKATASTARSISDNTKSDTFEGNGPGLLSIEEIDNLLTKRIPQSPKKSEISEISSERLGEF